MNAKVTNITEVRKIREAHLRDMSLVEGWGRIFGKSIVLPYSPENVEAIKAGPAALGNAADYFAMAIHEWERASIVDHFFEGARQHSRLGSFEIHTMFTKLRDSEEQVSLQRKRFN